MFYRESVFKISTFYFAHICLFSDFKYKYMDILVFFSVFKHVFNGLFRYKIQQNTTFGTETTVIMYS